jgi:hypothetical protein
MNYFQKNKKKLQRIFEGSLILLGFMALLFSPALAVISFGAVILNGLLGGASGKVGGIVGGKWKNVNYVRAYAKPSNPNSTDQQVQRSRMRQSVEMARFLLGSLIQPYWNKFYPGMSGFNAFIKYNIMQLASTTYYWTVNNIISRGNLLGVSGLSATYNTSNGEIVVSWADNTNGSTGLATDELNLVVLTKDGTKYFTEFTWDARDGASASLNIDSGLTAADVLLFGFFSRGTGSALEVSDSSAVQCTAP